MSIDRRSLVPADINQRLAGTMAGFLGIRVVEASLDRIVAELEIRPEIQNGGGIVHGGTLMAFADTAGAIATVVNLPEGARTTTIESKTNFLAAGRAGTMRAEATPLHKGRRTMVWQTNITDENGRLLSVTTQTQLVIT
ncbi:MAG: PaaI family thioesterase [Chloroflexota bacterium]